MLKTIKNTILVDETQSLEQIKKQFKSRTYWFLGLSWFVSFLLIWIIPQNIMQYDWAKSFVDFMGYIVPMVDGLEHIRLYGSSDPYKSHLVVLSHISFYYAVLWTWTFVSVPYMMALVKGNFRYNKDSNFIGFLQVKNTLNYYHNQRTFYYFGTFFLIPLVTLFIYVIAEGGGSGFRFRYTNEYISGFAGFIFTIGIFFSFISFSYIHFLIKHQGKQ